MGRHAILNHTQNITPMRTTNRKAEQQNQKTSDPLMTEGKYQELTQKLNRLKKNRPLLAAEVSRLAELGDFSENVEYQLAKGKLRGLNNAILVLENQLLRCEVITQPHQTDRVEIGHTVTVKCGNKQTHYQILGSTETDPQRGIISHNSPIGAALIGHKVGEKILVSLGNKKEVAYTIIKIQ